MVKLLLMLRPKMLNTIYEVCLRERAVRWENAFKYCRCFFPLDGWREKEEEMWWLLSRKSVFLKADAVESRPESQVLL